MSVVWDEGMSVGNPLLDSDHRILITVLNQLDDARDTGQSREVVASVVNVLAEYTEHHFQREEAIMAQAGYPHLAAHAALHRALETRVRDIRARWQGGDHGALGDEVVDFLRNWLTDHIMVVDKSYGPWVQNVGCGTREGDGGQ